MSKEFNRTIIVGRLASEPSYDDTKERPISQFTIVNSTIKDGNEFVDYHRVFCSGEQATLVRDYLHKGDLCCIEGALSRTKAGKVVIIATRITFLRSKRQEVTNEQSANA